ncbi:MAG: TonB-dependent receptor [Bacteroidota bacterium]
MKSLQLTLLFLCLFGTLYAQKINVQGTVTDTLNEPLVGATVMLLNAQDSVLTKFGITDDDGKFKLEKISPDDYILQISYLGYANLSQPILISNQLKNNNLGAFKLLPESAVLEQIEVKADLMPLWMKKDTLEYNAAAFKTKPNADVEALLKKLPGVEVDRNGTIKAQGEKVSKVLVDGKEFFGNDPKIATKNLPADAVEKVQVFDKKSDIAEFSGIDDGKEAKTINLSLKEDKKQGYFGKVVAGGGNEDRYENKFNLNRFGQKIQFSALGMFNNTNQQGFSINDYLNMMGGLNNLLAGGSGELSLNSEDLGLPLDFGQQNQGFTTTNAGGLNLNYELNSKTKIHTSYFYNGLNKTEAIAETQQNILGDNNFSTIQNANKQQRNRGHRLNLNLTRKIDSFQTIKWRNNVGFTQNDSRRNSEQQTFNLAQILENQGRQNEVRDGANLRWNSNLVYLRKFRKKGRFFTANAAMERQNVDRQSNLLVFNEFFNPIFVRDSLFQDQFNDKIAINYGVGWTYTEPIGKAKYLSVNYLYKNFKDEVERSVFDKKENTATFNPRLSNHFQRDYLYHRAGLTYKWNAKKWKLNAGIDAQTANLKGVFKLQNNELKRTFVNVLPKLFFTYDFKPTRTLRFDYRTSVQEPSLKQLQPIVDNSNPLILYVGNPELRPEYHHDFRLHFNTFDQFSSVSIFARLEGKFTDHKILNAVSIDEQFRQQLRPVNFGEERRLDGYLSFGAPIKPIKSRVNLTTKYGRFYGNYLVNNTANANDGANFSVDVNLSNKNTETIEWTLGYKWKDYQVNYPAEVQLNQSYSTAIFYADLSLNLTDSWTVSSIFDYTNYSNASFGDAIATAIWEASMDFHFLKNKKGTLSLIGRDLLNQNVGINRFNQANFLLDQRVTSLGRYFLLQFSYNLSGFRGSEEIEVVKKR